MSAQHLVVGNTFNKSSQDSLERTGPGLSSTVFHVQLLFFNKRSRPMYFIAIVRMMSISVNFKKPTF